MRTLEQRIKFDHALTIGRHLVRFTHQGNAKKALVDISKLGTVRYLLQPTDSDMYSTWQRVKGDLSVNDGAVVVWGAHSSTYMQQFDGEPVADIPAQST